MFEIQYSKQYQIDYYIKMCQNVANGFFGKSQTVLLPYTTANYWYLPDYNLFADPIFKKKIETTKAQTRYHSQNEILNALVNKNFDEFLTKQEGLSDEKLIKNLEEKLIPFLENLFGKLDDIEKFIIIPTKFGTNGTFTYEKQSSGKYTMYSTYRLGHIEHLPTTILASIIQLYTTFDNNIFMDFITRQKFIEFFGQHTLLKNMLGITPKSPTTLEIIKSNKSTYATDSLKYLIKMGYAPESSFAYDTNNIYFNNKPLLGLQDKEYIVLKYLIENKNKTISFDDLAETYWGEGWRDKFSLYSIVKIIERIRKKLKANGVKIEVINTVRKKGYCLYD